jgi:HPt (histidine-containing phosphotransfer) domain-containing protein
MTIAGQPPREIGQGVDTATPGVLDVADGIARVMGDRALYARMLRRFRSDYQHGVAPIRGAIASGDIRLAHRIAHTLKGAAGMVSAHALHQQASALELMLRHAACGQADALESLDSAISEALQVIDRLLDGDPAQGRAPHPPPAAVLPDRALLAQLAELLASGDGAAVDLLEASGASLKAALGEIGFCEVTLAANEFDFEGALEALRRLVDAGRKQGEDQPA